jgi:hypothetical protein
MIAYHGTPYIFKHFRRSAHGVLGPGIYFCDNEADVMPFSIKHGIDSAMIYKVNLSMYNAVTISGGEGTDELLKVICPRQNVFARREKVQGNYTFIVTSRDILKLKKRGYDGIIWKHQSFNEYVVWEPRQVTILETKYLKKGRKI